MVLEQSIRYFVENQSLSSTWIRIFAPSLFSILIQPFQQDPLAPFQLIFVFQQLLILKISIYGLIDQSDHLIQMGFLALSGKRTSTEKLTLVGQHLIECWIGENKQKYYDYGSFERLFLTNQKESP